MPNLRINTSQNVQIEYPTANVGIRIVSQLLDFVFLITYTLVVSFFAGIMGIRGASTIVFYLPAMFYSFIMESAFHGQSFGKMIMKTKVVRLDGSNPTLLNYFIRWIFRLVDVLIFYGIIGIVSVAAGSKGQRLGDRAAGTTVVSLQKRFNFKNSVYRAINDDYELKFPQVEKLDDSDISTINEVLLHFSRNPGPQASEILRITGDAVIKKTGIETNMGVLVFLRTVIKDYNYILRNETY